MSFNTSHSDGPPPLPPLANWIGLVFSVFMTITLSAFIGFIVIDFVAEMTGHPLRFFESAPTDAEAVPTEWDDKRELKSPFELITPRNQTQLLGPEVVVIYTVRAAPAASPDLLIKGVHHPWEMQFGDNTWFVRLQLPEGIYHIKAGEAEADFSVVAPDSISPLDDYWVLHHPHLETNDIARCSLCHEMSEESVYIPLPNRDRAIGSWKGISSCFACHDEQEHTAAHRFILPRTDRSLRCVRCHTIH